MIALVLLFRICLAGCLLGIVATIYFCWDWRDVGSSLLNLFVAAGLIAASIYCLKTFIGAMGDELDRRIIWLSIFVIVG
jgi:hypothetical protein